MQDETIQDLYRRQPNQALLIFQQVERASGLFRNSPKTEFLKNVASYMTSTLKLTPLQAGLVLKKASEVLDMFPSIAQVGELAAEIKRNSAKPKPIVTERVERYPWPNSILGLIEGLRERGKASTFALRTLRITEDEAEYLLNAYQRQAWSDPWAIEIIGKAKPNFTFGQEWAIKKT